MTTIVGQVAEEQRARTLAEQRVKAEAALHRLREMLAEDVGLSTATTDERPA